jgi:hypothetical protein
LFHCFGFAYRVICTILLGNSREQSL